MLMHQPDSCTDGLSRSVGASLRQDTKEAGVKICIFGAGAVGSHLAARLAVSGADVSAVARGAHLNAIQHRGIVLRSGNDEIRVAVRCVGDPSDLGAQDLVIVTVKGPALPAMVDGLKHLIGKRTSIVYAMNGIPWWYFYGLPGRYQDCHLPLLDPEGRLWHEIGVRRAVGCVIASANEVIEPGVVLHRAPRNRFTLGEPDGTDSERLKMIAALLLSAGFEAPVTRDIRSQIWRKFLTGNMAVSVLAALTGSTADVLLAEPETQGLCRQIVGEGLTLAAAIGVDLSDYDPVAQLDPRQVPQGTRPSMLQDLERGRPMEIDSFVTVIQYLAQATNTPMPTFDAVSTILKMRARSAGLYRA